MRFSTSISFITIIILMSFSLATSAATLHFNATLSGEQAGGIDTDGSGFATITLDDTENLLAWDIEWQDLKGDFTQAHFHGPAARNQNAGVQIPLTASGDSAVGTESISDEQAADLLAGLWYVNVHTDFAPGGEIRGQVQQIQPIPIPTSLLLMLSGVIGFSALRHR